MATKGIQDGTIGDVPELHSTIGCTRPGQACIWLESHAGDGTILACQCSLYCARLVGDHHNSRLAGTDQSGGPIRRNGDFCNRRHLGQ